MPERDGEMVVVGLDVGGKWDVWHIMLLISSNYAA